MTVTLSTHQRLQCVVSGHFNCLTGGARASPVEKIAPPVFHTWPPKILFNVRHFIISLNFQTNNLLFTANTQTMLLIMLQLMCL